ncbi:MAG: hypothetical protein QM504_02960 [Pseudomonadota bacterium]
MGFVLNLTKRFSLAREIAEPECPGDKIGSEFQAYIDRKKLAYKIWPYFYFNYFYSPNFDERLNDILDEKNIDVFVNKLINLFNLHYIASLLSLSSSEIKSCDFYRSHFYDMRCGVEALQQAKGDTACEVIDSALSDMVYHNRLYSWSALPVGADMNYFDNSHSLLFKIQTKLEKS